MRWIVVFLAFSTIASTGVAAAEQAPKFDDEAATPSVLVATSEPGEYYESPEECSGENVICLRYPLWFRAKPIQSVYGLSPERPIEVVTYTHYGQPEADDEKAPRILLLFAEGGHFMMPVYASERVWLRSDGQYYLLLNTSYPIHWLPCSVGYLRERIDPRMFTVKTRLALDEFSVKKHPDLFVRHKGYAIPKFGISVAQLGEHLKTLQPSIRDFGCGNDD